MKFNKIIMAAMAAITLLGASLAETKANPTPVSLPIYPLTNSLAATTNYIALTNGLTFVNTGSLYTVTSAPFTIWPHHGFTFNAGLFGTNSANTGNLGFTFRFASVHYSTFVNGSGYVTNWSTANNLTVFLPVNGTSEAFDWTNIQPAVVDNVSLGQLFLITNASTYGVNLDPTNFFVSSFP